MRDVQARYHHTLDLLTDPAAQAWVGQFTATLDATSDPKLAIMAGAERLANVRRVGVLAGSFNPPTNAHLALAASAQQSAQLDAVIWTISRVTVDKEQVTRAPLVSRLLVLAALVDALPHAAAGLINRGLYAEQAAAVRASLPHVQELAFIVGFDKIVQILDPRYYTDRDAALTELFHQARLLVAPRAHGDAADLATLLARPHNAQWAKFVTFIPLAPDLRDLASSTVRDRIAQHEAINDVAPPEAVALVDFGAYQAS